MIDSPEEKAEQLYNEFEKIMINVDCYFISDAAAQSSLITVREIINETYELDRLKYWKEVEQQLIKKWQKRKNQKK